jgi:acyl carrier protein
MDGTRLANDICTLLRGATHDTHDRGTIAAHLTLRQDLGLDSLALLNLFFRFAEELGVDPDELIELIGDEPMHTVADVVALGRRVTRNERKDGEHEQGG